MRQIVRMVENACRDKSGSVPAIVRLQISSHSHLANHKQQELETIFRLAAQGMRAQGSKLEIIAITAKGTCQDCGKTIDRTSDILTCPKCESGNLMWEDQPEVLLKEIECVQEQL